MVMKIDKKFSVALFVLGVGLMTACSSGDAPPVTTTSKNAPAAAGTTVQVSVAASDLDGDQLHYEWRATEGQVQDVDASSTQWTIPPGKGLQFLYVLVSDQKGGYQESRVGVLSGIDRVVSLTPSFTPTAGSTTNASLYGAMICGGSDANCPSSTRTIYLPDITVKLLGTGGRPTLLTDTNSKGEFFFQNIPPGSYTLQYALDRFTFIQSTLGTLSINSSSSYGSTRTRLEIPIGSAVSTMTRIAGHVNLRDPSASTVRDKPLCGTSNGFFRRTDTAQVQLGRRWCPM